MSIELNLSETWTDKIVDMGNLDQLITEARIHRSDLNAQKHRERSAEHFYKSVRAERIPSLSGFANYGSSGNTLNNNVPTWTVGLSLKLPIYDGGAVDARRAEMHSKLRQEKIKTLDLQKQIELEVRLAYENARIAQEQILVSEKRVALLIEELEQAKRRYLAGVTTSLELSDAQTRLQQAEESKIQTLRNYYISRVELLNAVGILRNTKIM
jgi:outer membrane protein TolC